MIQIQSTANVTNNQGIKCLVYGGAGYGKTVLASTCPNTIILSAESGLLSLRKFNLPYIEIRKIQDLQEAHLWAMNSKEAGQFETIYIDSLSEIAEVVLSDAKIRHKDIRQAYGELVDEMGRKIRSFRDLPAKNVVMSAKQEPIKDANGIIKFGPSMPGQNLSVQIPYLFDEMFRLGIGKTLEGKEYRFLQTQPDLQYDAKDRSGTLDVMEPPDLNFIFQKIKGDK